MLMRRFDAIPGLGIDRTTVRPDQALLIGAYFCNEYSFEAAALFNPSMVIHPDQTEVPGGSLRFNHGAARDRRGACVLGDVPYRP